MSNDWKPQFIFAVCQRGAEKALKHEVAASLAGARLAFSRPGFVTFKLDAPCDSPEQFSLPLTFARTYGFSLGRVTGEQLKELAEQAWNLPTVGELLKKHPPGDLHVWQRDTALPGERGFEPGPTPLAEEAERALRLHSPLESLRTEPATPRPPSRRNGWVLDVVLVEPNQWWIGCHPVNRRFDGWPGGVRPLDLPAYAASRAYLKMEEALDWSALPIARGNLCVELGCAPGGAAQALLDRGLSVLGVDPAEVDPEVEAHPRFLHIRRRSLDVPRRQYLGVQWLAADMNVAPAYTLDAVESIVKHEETAIRGLLLTLKLADWKLAEELPKYVERVRSWGYRDVRTRQLAFNRQEICLVALRNRSQRRVRRHSRRHLRSDAAHTGKPAGPHLPVNM